MTKQLSIVAPLIAGALSFSSMGCSTTVRSMSATAWIAPPAAQAAAPAAEGQPAAASGGIVSQYYLTYWEGKCSGTLGCSRGDTHVKRCKVAPDNSVACSEEANASKALNPD